MNEDVERTLEQLARDIAADPAYNVTEAEAVAKLREGLTSSMSSPFRVVGGFLECRWPRWLCAITRHRVGPHEIPPEYRSPAYPRVRNGQEFVVPLDDDDGGRRGD